jgi:hypothetical protein
MSIREGPFGSSVKVAAGIDDHRLAGLRFSAAHREHHIGAIVLVGGVFQKLWGSVPSRVTEALPEAAYLKTLTLALD